MANDELEQFTFMVLNGVGFSFLKNQWLERLRHLHIL